MSKEHTIGKSLKGVYTSSNIFDIDILQALFEKGGLVLNNVEINSSIINSTQIGGYIPSPLYATTFQTGTSLGEGYDVFFYGQTIGEYLHWDSLLGTLNINGGLNISQALDLGNLRLSGNTLSSTNTNGNIILDPNGTGIVSIPQDTNLSLGSVSKYLTSTASSLNLVSNDNLSIVSPNISLTGNLTLDDIILTLGGSIPRVSDDNKDRGIEFRYYTSSSKLGFFGYDDTDGYFTYIPDATNTADVISGALGNAKFAIGSFTSLNLNSGNISNVDTISSAGDLTIQPGIASDLILNVDSGSNIIIPPNVDLLFDGETSKIYSDGVNLNVDVTGGDFNVDTNTTITGDLTVTGNVNFTGTVTSNLTVERFTISGGSASSPSIGSNITFITITGSGIATGTMPQAVADGFFKNIAMVSIASGCSYELTFPIGTLVDPVSGTSVAKKMIFDTTGQGVQLVWDNTASVYVITQGGAQIVAV
jgi:phage baseplate assembly protein gpV